MQVQTKESKTSLGKISQTEKTILASILNNPCEEAFACECADKCDGKKCLCRTSERWGKEESHIAFAIGPLFLLTLMITPQLCWNSKIKVYFLFYHFIILGDGYNMKQTCTSYAQYRKIDKLKQTLIFSKFFWKFWDCFCLNTRNIWPRNTKESCNFILSKRLRII